MDKSAIDLIKMTGKASQTTSTPEQILHYTAASASIWETRHVDLSIFPYLALRNIERGTWAPILSSNCSIEHKMGNPGNNSYVWSYITLTLLAESRAVQWSSSEWCNTMGNWKLEKTGKSPILKEGQWNGRAKEGNEKAARLKLVN